MKMKMKIFFFSFPTLINFLQLEKNKQQDNFKRCQLMKKIIFNLKKKSN